MSSEAPSSPRLDPRAPSALCNPPLARFRVLRLELRWNRKCTNPPIPSICLACGGSLVEMTEQDFWGWLERRVSAEFAGFDDRRLRFLWCDGFIPEDYALATEPATIAGRVWIGTGPRQQEQWTFALLLPQAVDDVSAVDWAGLLPPGDSTGWLGPNQSARHLDIEPAVAVPDHQI